MTSGFKVTYGNNTFDLLNEQTGIPITFLSSSEQPLISNPDNSDDLSPYFNDTTFYETTDISNLFISSKFSKIHTLTSGPGAIHPRDTGYQISGVDLCNNAIAMYDIMTVTGFPFDWFNITKYNECTAILYGGGGAGGSNRQPGSGSAPASGAGGSGATIYTTFNCSGYDYLEVNVGTGGTSNDGYEIFPDSFKGGHGNGTTLKVTNGLLDGLLITTLVGKNTQQVEVKVVDGESIQKGMVKVAIIATWKSHFIILMVSLHLL